MGDQIEQYVTRFLLAWRREVTHAVWGLLRASLMAFLAVLIVGGGLVTIVLYNLDIGPFRGVALLVWALLIVAALAVAAMTASLYFSISVLRGIERAGRRIIQEARQLEGEIVHSVSTRLPDLGEHRPDR
jgi:hypothetical protein